MILKFTSKILQKEKSKLILPFFSILITTIVVVLSYFLISSARDFLISKNKEFLGGDIILESAKIFEIKKYIDENIIDKKTEQVNFSGILKYKENGFNVDFTFVDKYFPLYGEIKIRDDNYKYLKKNEIYIDESLEKRMNIKTGEEIFFNDKSFIVKGIILENPENLIAGFSFSPKVILSTEALIYSNVDLSFFRKEYRNKVILKENINLNKQDLKDLGRKDGVRISFLGESRGIQFGLEIVEKFLVVVVLIIIILSLVNIYASINFLAERLRRSFAIFMSLGLENREIYKILLLINSILVFLSAFLGILISYFISKNILLYIQNNFNIQLLQNLSYKELLLIFIVIYITSFFATIPVFNKLKSVTPKELLSHNENKSNNNFIQILKDISIVIIPIIFFAIYFLNSYLYGFGIVLSIMLIYGFIVVLYKYFILLLYKSKNFSSFPLRLIIAQKKFDGFLGMITFASLFVALISVFSLSILRTSIEDYLKVDLKENLPSVYILDIQKSQIDNFIKLYKDVNLFPNVRARLVSIDGLDIQKEIEKEDSKLDQEFRREFNLTYREKLLNTEEVIEGDFNNLNIGEVSLEENFAKRLNAKIGSELVVNIQGFEIKNKVTSIRKVDSRSGLPFFYLIYSTKELEKFPTTFFGYINLQENEINNLYLVLAENFPNVSIINTISISKIAETIIQTLIIIILIITIPPITLALLLILTIISSSLKDRRRDAARLMALGKTNNFIRNYFIFETISTTFLACIFAYIFSIIISNFVIIYFLKIQNIIYLDIISLLLFIILLLIIIAFSFILWYNDKKNIKEYLNYEENN